ncbi:GNAT family N-acetyltransferase [Gemmata sp. JC673]|uniref:GNAT family N-acetyltransferase n=1 Tax=Gemmata algarum TaxID=2975278 RepID=A0ABU5F462_9BACT|nr:GNAT family N-acetyltransferase [Gemmata algarum]MDY3562186.1 GNAT family N-acetyltransferase [Gemmata algarum]
MTPEQVAASYDQIADRWLDLSTYGFAQLERAVAFVKHKGTALDVGCGTGRLMGLLSKHGFRTDGLDVSPAMLAHARNRFPEARLFHGNICRWRLPHAYDLIVAWDSVWHVPLSDQEAVLTKLCRGLAAGGVLVFSTGGTDGPDERQNSLTGPPMYHATLGVPKALRVLADAGCVCRHLEYDQYPEGHVYIIAQKREYDGPQTCGPVRLRAVHPGDLLRMFEMQLDPDSNRMAVTNPRTAEAFVAHWAKALSDPACTTRAVLGDEVFVGYICCFPIGGEDHVGYWIDKPYWGKGIASRALHLLLREVARRPLVASVATGNGASLRVLQKHGFVIERVHLAPATERYPECEEAVLVLRHPGPPDNDNGETITAGQ